VARHDELARNLEATDTHTALIGWFRLRDVVEVYVASMRKLR
jgi:hypothetical protein